MFENGCREVLKYETSLGSSGRNLIGIFSGNNGCFTTFKIIKIKRLCNLFAKSFYFLWVKLTCSVSVEKNVSFTFSFSYNFLFNSFKNMSIFNGEI